MESIHMESGILSARINEKRRGQEIRARQRHDRLDFYDELNVGPCLLVSRELGAGGSQIASKVAQRLGWVHLDKEIIEKLASQYGTPRVVLDAVDEKKIGWVADLLNGWIEGHGFSQLSYVNRLGRLFNMAAKLGNVVIVGRGAKFLLPKAAGFSVRIIAPMEFRVEQVVLRQGVTAQEARTLIQRSDADRKTFIKRFFHHDVTDPHSHDLVVNIKQVTPDFAVQLICDAVRFWVNRSGFQEVVSQDGALVRLAK
jgi:cytidylate kinase